MNGPWGRTLSQSVTMQSRRFGGIDGTLLHRYSFGFILEPWWRPFRKIGNVIVMHVDLRPYAAREAEALG